MNVSGGKNQETVDEIVDRITSRLKFRENLLMELSVQVKKLERDS